MLSDLERRRGVFPVVRCEPSVERRRKSERRWGAVVWGTVMGVGIWLALMF